MGTSPKKKTNKVQTPHSISQGSVSTSMPSGSTPSPIPSSSSATSYTATSETTSSTPGCSTAFVCGQQNFELKQRIEDLEKRVYNVEETAAEKRSFLKKTESLLLVFKVVLIAIPVILFIALATVQYFFYADSKLLNFVTGVIGLTTVAECIALPFLWKSIDSRLEKVEEQLKE